MKSGLRQIATEPAYLSHITTMDKKRSPQPPPRNKTKSHLSHTNVSDSDASAETNSLSAESANEQPKELPNFSNSKKNLRRRGSEWEIVEGLKDGQRFEKKPEVFTGYLHKKRKWPLKGWHKRYFVLEKGILTYAKNPADITRGKIHGQVDIGLSVISTKEKRRRIDIDAEEFIYHLKSKQADVFDDWVKQLRAHRLYRQHVLTYGLRDVPLIRATDEERSTHFRYLEVNGNSKNDSKIRDPLYDITKYFQNLFRSNVNFYRGIPITPPELSTRDGSLPRGMKPPGSGSALAGGRLATWLVDSGPPLEQVQREVTQVQLNIAQLNRILEHLDGSASLTASVNADNELVGDGFSPTVKKDRKKFGLRKKKSSKGSSVDLTTVLSQNRSAEQENASPLSMNSFTGLSTSPQTAALSTSNTSLAGIGSMPIPGGTPRPQSLPGPEHLAPLSSGSSTDRHLSGTPDYQLREDFTILSKDVISSLKSIVFTLVTERDRLKAAIDSDTNTALSQNMSNPNIVTNLRNSLNQALQQNSELKVRLARVHDVSDLSDLSSVEPASETQCRQYNTSLSYSSSCVSASEFFDAEDLPIGGMVNSVRVSVEEKEAFPMEQRGGGASDTSSEAGSLSSEEGSISSESEVGGDYNRGHSLEETESNTQYVTGRRTKLPVPRPSTEGLSLWNLLCKNIGKDLSQISMPVALNEPLNMLQRLCEELEYSELLDKAAELDDPYERMIYVAAFAVSSYASSYFRAGNKPFNPLLGETYECIREDKGFKFISEQVSHHPPVSVCHAESRNFVFWQDARIKTKFWGKSMEFQPLGMVNLFLPRTGDRYQWNKVTTCVHNLFSGQRWVDQYGELRITDGKIVCKLTFVKASYWSAKRHEIYGTVMNEDGKVVRKLFGKWSEALYCGVAPSAKCIWRPGTMPEDYEIYYGFTRFAMELNELESETMKFLPRTDTRLRPDQRALENGDIDTAENVKMQLEQAQRERRKRNEAQGLSYVPRWFRKNFADNGEETWEYNGAYWEMRKNPGFASMAVEPLW